MNTQIQASFINNILTTYIVTYNDNSFNAVEYCHNVNSVLNNLNIKI